MPIISGSSGGSGGGAFTQTRAVILAAPAATFDITAISGSFNHLLAVVRARGDTVATNTSLNLTFNADGGTNYDRENMSVAGTGTPTGGAASAGTSAFIASIPAASATASVFGTSQFLIPWYSTTDAFKQVMGDDAIFYTLGSTGTYGIDKVAVLWRSTAAITRITLTPAAGNLIAGSRITLYGLT